LTQPEAIVVTLGAGIYQNDTAADVKEAKMSIRILEPHNSRCNASDRGYPHHVQCVRIGDVPVTPQIMDIVIPPGD
jgi:hypothetical protein